MHVLAILLQVVWGILLIRALCWRSTLALRTVFTYALVGAAFAFFWSPVVTRLVDPLYEPGVMLNFLVNASLLLLLLAPVLFHYFGRRLDRQTSIADAWLLAFAVGFGHDLAGVLLVTTASPSSISFSYLPPLRLISATASSVGYGYWCAAIALIIAACLRLTGSRKVAAMAGTLAVILAAGDGPLWFGAPENWLGAIVKTLTLHGALTPWLVLGALVFFSWKEAQQVVSHSGASVSLHSGWVKILNEVKRGNSKSLNAWLTPQIAALRAALPSISEVLPWLPLFAFLLFPSFNTLLSNAFFGYSLSSLFDLTIFQSVLAALIAYAYLTAGFTYRRSSADDELTFAAENSLLRTCLWGLVLVCLVADWTAYYPFLNAASLVSGLALPAYQLADLRTLTLLFALAIAAQTRQRSVQSASQPNELRRRAFMMRCFTAMCVVVIYIGSTKNYLTRLEAFHQRYGYDVYNWSVRLGTNGNKIAYLVFAALNLLRMLPLLIMLGLFLWRLRRIFPSPRAQRMQTLAAVAIGALIVGVDHVYAGGCGSPGDCICIPPGAHTGGGGAPAAGGAVVIDSVQLNEGDFFTPDPPPTDATKNNPGTPATPTDPNPPNQPTKTNPILNQPLGDPDDLNESNPASNQPTGELGVDS